MKERVLVGLVLSSKLRVNQEEIALVSWVNRILGCCSKWFTATMPYLFTKERNLFMIIEYVAVKCMIAGSSRLMELCMKQFRHTSEVTDLPTANFRLF